MNALKFSEPNKKPNRAVVIILDKILFDSTKAFKGIRQKLLREYNLKGVFSMPAGIFQPYSGVKTTVLYFEKPTKGDWNKIKENNDYTTKQVLFFDVKSDGFTLSTQRRPLNGAFQGDEPNIYEPPCGDLPKAVEVFKEWLKALDNGKVEEFKEKYVDNEQVWIADIDEIKEKDFNLNPGLYRKVERGKVKWDWVRLENLIKNGILTINYGKQLLKKEFLKEGYPVFGANGKIGFYSRYMYEDPQVIVGCRGSVGKVWLTESFSWITNNSLILEINDETIIDQKFFYFVLNNIDKSKIITGSNQPQITINKLSSLEIPFPPLEIQQKIVERLDKQQAIIEKAKEMEKGLVRYILIRDFDDSNEGSEKKYVKDNPKLKKCYPNDVLIDRYGAYAGKPLIGMEGVYTNNMFKLIILKKDQLLSKYLYYWIKTQYVQNLLISSYSSSTQKQVSHKALLRVKIPLPPLEKQKEIVEFLDVQFEALEKIRKLRENAEKTIKIILEKEVFGNE